MEQWLRALGEASLHPWQHPWILSSQTCQRPRPPLHPQPYLLDLLVTPRPLRALPGASSPSAILQPFCPEVLLKSTAPAGVSQVAGDRGPALYQPRGAALRNAERKGGRATRTSSDPDFLGAFLTWGRPTDRCMGDSARRGDSDPSVGSAHRLPRHFWEIRVTAPGDVASPRGASPRGARSASVSGWLGLLI